MTALRHIHLHGALGTQFGKHHRLAVDSVPEVIDALRANFPEFFAAIRYGFYRIVLGKTKTSGLTLRENQIVGLNLGERAVHIVPSAQGRKNGGLGKVVAGIALIGLSAATFGAGGLMGASLWSGGATLGQMAGTLGASMALAGVATMIAPEQEAGDDKKSFTMSGPVSDVREGQILPIVYGEVITGGYMISGSVIINGPAGETGLPGGGAANQVTGAVGGSARERVDQSGTNADR